MDNARPRDEQAVAQGCELDHLVVTAADLRSGTAWVRELLGAEPQPGGEHREMGTHNRLLRLGATVYLEVIARNPNAYKPEWPRWFGLDHVKRGSAPRLATWVARTRDIRAAYSASTEPLGEIGRMSRDDLEWLITVPENGELVLGGAAPMLIEWPAQAAHPASRLPDSGCTLLRLEVFHPDPDRVAGLLQSVGFAGDAGVCVMPTDTQPHLVAHIDTAHGVKMLGGA